MAGTLSRPPSKISTWRERIVTIPASSTIEIVFDDTNPNYFYINNLSDSVIYLGVTALADATTYDAYVNPHDDNLYARDVGYSRITLYNAGATEARVKLCSFVQEFDPATLLNKTTVTLTQLANLIVEIAGAIPAGTNHIGGVNVDNFPATQSVSGTVGVNNFPATQDVHVTSPLPAGTNVIGHTIKDYAATTISLANAVIATPGQTFTTALLPAGQAETLFVNVSAATTITVLVSPDNVNFYQTASWVAAAAGSNVFTLPLASYVQVVTSNAVTITAQLQVTQ